MQQNQAPVARTLGVSPHLPRLPVLSLIAYVNPRPSEVADDEGDLIDLSIY